MEEATQFTETQYYAMTECCRPHGLLKTPFSPRMYFTCNPGGVGHAWVKRLFLDREYRDGERAEDYVFIPSTVYDNPYLMQHDPDYVRSLESLPELRRRAMLYGDWDAFEGQFFPEFSREKHVIEPFSIPKDWLRFAALDYGLDMTACLWLAYPRDQSRVVVYRELYEPDLILSRAAEKISERQKGEEIRFIAASPDLAGRRQDSGKTGFDILSLHGLTGLLPAANARIPGWRRLREFLKAGDGETPFLGIFPQCANLIRTLPRLIFDPHAPEDAANDPHEITHAPDALRYGVMQLPFLPGAAPHTRIAPARSLEEEFFGKQPRKGEYVSFIVK